MGERLKVSTQRRCSGSANVRQQQSVGHHTAAKYDALDRQHECNGGGKLPQITANDLPGSVLGRQIRQLASPTFVNGGPAREPLHAIAMKGTHAGKRVAWVATHGDVPHLWMHQPV